jgi:hypothetical protein
MHHAIGHDIHFGFFICNLQLPNPSRPSAELPIGSTQMRVLCFLLLLCCAGCGNLGGYIRQAISPDLWILSRNYGVATVPTKDKEIVFQNRMIDDAEFAKALKHVRRYGWVEVLGLEGQPITNTSIPLICKLPHIREIYLPGTNVTPDGLSQLAALPNLERLIITKGLLTPAELSQLQQTLNAEIREDPRQWPLPFQGQPQTQPAVTTESPPRPNSNDPPATSS